MPRKTQYLKVRPLLVSKRNSGHLSQDGFPLSNFTRSSKGTTELRLSASSGNMGLTVMFHWKAGKQKRLESDKNILIVGFRVWRI